MVLTAPFELSILLNFFLVSMMMLQKINKGNGSRRIIDQLGLVVRQGEEGESSFIPNIQTSRKTLVIMGIYGE